MFRSPSHRYTSMDTGRRIDIMSVAAIAISLGCLSVGCIALFDETEKMNVGTSNNQQLALAAARTGIRPAAAVTGMSLFAPRGYASSVVRRSPGLSAFASVSTQTPKTDLKLDWGSLKSDLESMIKEKQCGPILIRLSWHDAGTYCKADGTGGARGAQRFTEGESTHGANAGLDVARDLLADMQAKYPISAADLWAFASLVATEVMGGPKIPFRAGREDIADQSLCVEEGRLPDGDKGSDHLRSVFGRMGFSDKDIVVLSGAHTVGKCHANRSGFDGAWTEMPLQWDNAYFKNLLTKDYKAETTAQGNPQYRDGDVIALETDLALTTDPEFRKYTELFANNLDEFNKAYAETYQKLQELGWESKGLTEIAW